MCHTQRLNYNTDAKLKTSLAPNMIWLYTSRRARNTFLLQCRLTGYSRWLELFTKYAAISMASVPSPCGYTFVVVKGMLMIIPKHSHFINIGDAGTVEDVQKG